MYCELYQSVKKVSLEAALRAVNNFLIISPDSLVLPMLKEMIYLLI